MVVTVGLPPNIEPPMIVHGNPLNCVALLSLAALACCENIPTPMDDVIIVKTAVVATIASSIRVFILYINLATPSRRGR